MSEPLYHVHHHGEAWGVHAMPGWRTVSQRPMSRDDAVSLCERLNREATEVVAKRAIREYVICTPRNETYDLDPVSVQAAVNKASGGSWVEP